MLAFPKQGRIKLEKHAYARFKQDILELDGHRCKHCGRRDFLTLEHHIPRSKIRLDTVENCYTCCVWCNQLIKDRGIAVDWDPETRTVRRRQ